MYLCVSGIKFIFAYCLETYIFEPKIFQFCLATVHKTSLIPPLFIEVHVPSQESDQSWICVLVVSSLFLLIA
jgi:hypothetical protein